jgi:hypothetical protein
MLWTILVIFMVLWAAGFRAHIGGNMIHLLLITSLVLFIIQLVAVRRAF